MSFFEKNDCVVIDVLKDNRDAGYNPAPDGTIGTIVGFNEICYGYINNFGMKPGTYLNKYWPHVKLETGETIQISTCHIRHSVDGLIEERRKAYLQLSEEERRFIENGERVGDLPETHFWPGDVVRSSKHNGEKLIIRGIDYTNIDSKCHNGSQYPFYNISYSFDDWYTVAREEELELVERGNVWKHYHEEPLEFDTLEEEGRFFKMIGHTTEVRNPNNNLYDWTLEEALQAIKDGLADAVIVTNTPLINLPVTSVIKYNDSKLGRRIAELTLRGFADLQSGS